MRTTVMGALLSACGGLVCGGLVCGQASALDTPPFKGNDTGGIIAYEMASQTDIRALAVAHCAQYGKVVKLTGVQSTYGGYLSFHCIWVPTAQAEQPLSVRY